MGSYKYYSFKYWLSQAHSMLDTSRAIWVIKLLILTQASYRH